LKKALVVALPRLGAQMSTSKFTAMKRADGKVAMPINGNPNNHYNDKPAVAMNRDSTAKNFLSLSLTCMIHAKVANSAV
jgi:hypothetical protein